MFIDYCGVRFQIGWRIAEIRDDEVIVELYPIGPDPGGDGEPMLEAA